MGYWCCTFRQKYIFWFWRNPTGIGTFRCIFSGCYVHAFLFFDRWHWAAMNYRSWLKHKRILGESTEDWLLRIERCTATGVNADYSVRELQLLRTGTWFTAPPNSDYSARKIVWLRTGSEQLRRQPHTPSYDLSVYCAGLVAARCTATYSNRLW